MLWDYDSRFLNVVGGEKNEQEICMDVTNSEPVICGSPEHGTDKNKQR